MAQEQKAPTQKMAESTFDGMEVIDSLGRIIKLKTPDVLDEYDLMSALGEDSSNPSCLGMASAMLFVASIDGTPLFPPKAYSDVRSGIQRIKREGFKALTDFITQHQATKTEQEVIAEIKK